MNSCCLYLYTSQTQLASVMFPLPVDHANGNESKRVFYNIYYYTVARCLWRQYIGLNSPARVHHKIQHNGAHTAPRGPETRFKIIVIASRSSPDPWRWKSAAKSHPSPHPPPTTRTNPETRRARRRRQRTRTRILTSAIVSTGVAVYRKFIFTLPRVMHTDNNCTSVFAVTVGRLFE